MLNHDMPDPTNPENAPPAEEKKDGYPPPAEEPKKDE